MLRQYMSMGQLHANFPFFIPLLLCKKSSNRTVNWYHELHGDNKRRQSNLFVDATLRQQKTGSSCFLWKNDRNKKSQSLLLKDVHMKIWKSQSRQVWWTEQNYDRSPSIASCAMTHKNKIQSLRNIRLRQEPGISFPPPSMYAFSTCQLVEIKEFWIKCTVPPALIAKTAISRVQNLFCGLRERQTVDGPRPES